MIMSAQDERMLQRMGIDPRPPAPSQSDPHHECIVRWLQERDNRERAERALYLEAESFRCNLDTAERRAQLWKIRAWFFGVASLAFAIACILLVGRR